MIVTKEYECPKCGPIEIEQVHNRIAHKCPTCKSPIERLIGLPIISKLGDPRTVGSQIELNNKRNPLTREQRVGGSDMEKKLKYREEVSKWGQMSDEQKAQDFKKRFG